MLTLRGWTDLPGQRLLDFGNRMPLKQKAVAMIVVRRTLTRSLVLLIKFAQLSPQEVRRADHPAIRESNLIRSAGNR